MKLFTYKTLNFKKWFSNSTIEFLVSCLKKGKKLNLYYFCFQRYFPFYHSTKNWIYYFILHQYAYL